MNGNRIGYDTILATAPKGDRVTIMVSYVKSTDLSGAFTITSPPHAEELTNVYQLIDGELVYARQNGPLDGKPVKNYPLTSSGVIKMRDSALRSARKIFTLYGYTDVRLRENGSMTFI